MICATAPVWCRSLGNYSATSRPALMSFKPPRTPNPNLVAARRWDAPLPPRKHADARMQDTPVVAVHADAARGVGVRHNGTHAGQAPLRRVRT